METQPVSGAQAQYRATIDAVVRSAGKFHATDVYS
jgi:hypothetical protein